MTMPMPIVDYRIDARIAVLCNDFFFISYLINYSQIYRLTKQLAPVSINKPTNFKIHE